MPGEQAVGVLAVVRDEDQSPEEQARAAGDARQRQVDDVAGQVRLGRGFVVRCVHWGDSVGTLRHHRERTRERQRESSVRHRDAEEQRTSSSFF